MIYATAEALALVKVRLNKTKCPAEMDAYLTKRIEGAGRYLRKKGIRLDMTDSDDFMLLVDVTVWQYNNRDSAGDEPRWLKRRTNQRFVNEKGDRPDDP